MVNNIYETFDNFEERNKTGLIDCGQNNKLCDGGYNEDNLTRLNFKHVWNKFFPDKSESKKNKSESEKNKLDKEKVNIWLNDVEPITNNEKCINSETRGNFNYNVGNKYAKYAFVTGFVILLWLYMLASFIAGFYAWNEFPDDLLVHKIVKTYFAVIASPLYLLYIFIRISFFK